LNWTHSLTGDIISTWVLRLVGSHMVGAMQEG
jgi:hypothetical protein